MTIVAGTRLGPYEVIAPLGAGGMGEVWKARDTRLDRSVAIKVLPREFAENAQLKLRFEREAKTISQLEHPHICRLYDVGESTGEAAGARLSYLVMELLEGESLADRLTRGPLPLNEVLKFGAQIAEALDRAHRAGVVHRDLKPGNIMLTKSGAKLLDFGLAKSATLSGAPTSSSAYQGATQQKPLTEQGTILGTFQYMAPEQLEGHEADARTDIFALGAVLYEMATGKRAFEGKTKTSLIAAIIRDEPRPISQLQPLTPPMFEHVVNRCLEKEPDDRWQSAHDVAEELKWIGEAGSQAGVSAPLIERRKNRERFVWIALLLATIAASAAYIWRLSGAEHPIVAASIEPPPQTEFAKTPPALSPDGRYLAAIVRPPGGNWRLHVRALDGSWSKTYEGSEGAYAPFWTPDSSKVVIHVAMKLRQIDREGGSGDDVPGVVTNGVGGSVGTDGTMLYVNDNRIFRTREGDAPVPVTRPERGERHSWPLWLPDGKHFIFYRRSEPAAATDGIVIAHVTTGKAKLLVPSFSTGILLNGHLLYVRGRTLFARRLDVGEMKLTGPEVRLRDDVGFVPGAGALLVSATDRQLVYLPTGQVADTELVIVDRSGNTLQTVGAEARYYTPRLSRDATRIAVDISDPASNSGDIWIFDIKRNTSSRITHHKNNESGAVWSPDDATIIFLRSGANEEELLSRPARTGGEERSLGVTGASVHPLDISPDGQSLLFAVRHAERGTDVELYGLSDRKRSALFATTSFDGEAQFHNNGKWIAYTSDESGRAEVYVQPFGSDSGKWRVSPAGGYSPAWSRDGKELFFISYEGKMMRVPVTISGGTFEHAAPQELFDVRMREDSPHRQYDVLPDGTFLLNRNVDRSAKPLTIVSNWTLLLKK